jgi:predicted membrane channel-forming protein YqfA (hemolysin III family)
MIYKNLNTIYKLNIMEVKKILNGWDGHSHQIWHVIVVLGIIFTYFGVMENFEMRKVSICPA